MTALALFGSVLVSVAGGLRAWLMWLTHLEAERGVRARNIEAELAKVAALEQQVMQVEKRLQSFEIRNAGR